MDKNDPKYLKWKQKYNRNPFAQDIYPVQPEAMFPITELRKAYEYFMRNTKGIQDAANFFHWLNTLVKDIPFDQQRYQP